MGIGKLLSDTTPQLVCSWPSPLLPLSSWNTCQSVGLVIGDDWTCTEYKGVVRVDGIVTPTTPVSAQELS